MMTPTTPFKWPGFKAAHAGLTDWNGRGSVRLLGEQGFTAQTAGKIFAGRRGENLLPPVKVFPKKGTLTPRSVAL